MSDRKYVSICVPSGGEWKAKTGAFVAQLAVTSLMRCDLAIVQDENSSISVGRNYLIQGSLNNDADYVLFVDSDMVGPPNALLRLLEHDLDIVCATYARRKPPYETLGEWEPTDFQAPGRMGVVRASRVPAGFLLIKSEVFYKLPAPWFFEEFRAEYVEEQNPMGHSSDDYNFCQTAIEAGFQPHIDFDLSFEMGHIGEQIAVCRRAQQRVAA